MPELKPRAKVAARPAGKPARQLATKPAQRPVARPSQAQLIAESRQPARLILALVLLLVAFGGIIAHDHQFWFGSDESRDAEFTPAPKTAQAATKLPEAAPIQARIEPAKIEAKTLPVSVPAVKAKKSVAAAKNSVPVQTAPVNNTPAVASNRVAVAPLDVEVVAGDNHKMVRPGSNATKVEILSNSKNGLTAKLNTPTNAAELERVNSVQPALGSGDGTYPLLAQQMKVQGSVVLQAFIGADGTIQSLHVMSGPTILASAAQQAVREWRFKPYLVNGQPVETKATITVNFTIKVADNTAAKIS